MLMLLLLLSLTSRWLLLLLLLLSSFLLLLLFLLLGQGKKTHRQCAAATSTRHCNTRRDPLQTEKDQCTTMDPTEKKKIYIRRSTKNKKEAKDSGSASGSLIRAQVGALPAKKTKLCCGNFFLLSFGH